MQRDYSAVAIILPALNEAASLRTLLPELDRIHPAQIVVGDNGSTDETAEVIRVCGVESAYEPRRGYGAACWAAMLKLRNEVRVVVFLDADSSDDLTRLPDLVDPILRDEADFVIGTRDAASVERGALSIQQRFGNWLATGLIRLRWGFAYRDLGPFRAIRREALDRIQMRDRAYGWTVEMQIRALQERLRIKQISVHYKRRIGKSKIGGTIGGSLKAGYWILRTIARHWMWAKRGRESF